MSKVSDGSGSGAALEVRLANGVWHRGRLLQWVAGTEPLRWRVQFDDGEIRDDIVLGNPEAPVRFEASAYGAVVEVRFADGEWYIGRLVELVRGGDRWGVAFEDGDWAEDVRLGDPDVRYAFAGGEPRRGGKRGRMVYAGEDAGPRSRKRADGKGAGRPGGPDRRHEGRGGRATGCLECGMCGRAFPAPSKLAAHMRTHTGEKPHVCETCGKAFPRSCDLARHLRTHTGERLHVCETCGHACSSSSHLAVHMRTHSGEKPRVCETCSKAFSRSDDLARHMRTHTGEKPYVCETCGKAFSDSENLARHILTHSGERLHVCETCGKAFALSGTLARHMRTHSGEKPHVCETCSKAFSTSGHLTVHMRTHSGERPHVCGTCGKAFSQSNNLTKHLRTHSGKRGRMAASCAARPFRAPAT